MLAENKLGDKGATVLASVLRVMPRLTTLDVSSTHVRLYRRIKRAGDVALDADHGLAGDDGLGNALEDEGICAIVDVVHRLPRLKWLYLNRTFPNGRRKLTAASQVSDGLLVCFMRRPKTTVVGTKGEQPWRGWGCRG